MGERMGEGVGDNGAVNARTRRNLTLGVLAFVVVLAIVAAFV